MCQYLSNKCDLRGVCIVETLKYLNYENRHQYLRNRGPTICTIFKFQECKENQVV